MPRARSFGLFSFLLFFARARRHRAARASVGEEEAREYRSIARVARCASSSSSSRRVCRFEAAQRCSRARVMTRSRKSSFSSATSTDTLIDDARERAYKVRRAFWPIENRHDRNRFDDQHFCVLVESGSKLRARKNTFGRQLPTLFALLDRRVCGRRLFFARCSLGLRHDAHRLQFRCSHPAPDEARAQFMQGERATRRRPTTRAPFAVVGARHVRSSGAKTGRRRERLVRVARWPQ